MPLYEYQCKKCGHKFEKIQKFSDPPIRKCPQCGGKVEKLLSAPAVQFKGTGWYVTDYARKGKEPAHADHKPSEKKTDKTESAAGGISTSEKSDKKESSDSRHEKKHGKSESRK